VDPSGEKLPARGVSIAGAAGVDSFFETSSHKTSRAEPLGYESGSVRLYQRTLQKSLVAVINNLDFRDVVNLMGSRQQNNFSITPGIDTNFTTAVWGSFTGQDSLAVNGKQYTYGHNRGSNPRFVESDTMWVTDSDVNLDAMLNVNAGGSLDT